MLTMPMPIIGRPPGLSRRGMFSLSGGTKAPSTADAHNESRRGIFEESIMQI